MAFNLIPKNDAYFEDFDKAVEIVHRIAKLLREGVGQPIIPKELWRSVKALEKEADEVVKVCLARLDETFITPIEREDIHLLIVTIDDVADAMEAAASRFNMYEIELPTEELRNITETLEQMTEQLVISIRDLRTLRGDMIRESTTKVDMLEEKVDMLFRDALRVLFKRHPEAFDLVRWKEVYEILERAADHCRAVARTVRHIIVRHS